ncbi:hypothetical protein AMECASPLE_034859 [Ameca splendens]|uniref:Uncharacterized protein n=1 Tax=Ameca splendens TaxID=208324 RepID=A0ABV0XW71_9TELE
MAREDRKMSSWGNPSSFNFNRRWLNALFFLRSSGTSKVRAVLKNGWMDPNLFFTMYSQPLLHLVTYIRKLKSILFGISLTCITLGCSHCKGKVVEKFKAGLGCKTVCQALHVSQRTVQSFM